MTYREAMYAIKVILRKRGYYGKDSDYYNWFFECDFPDDMEIGEIVETGVCLYIEEAERKKAEKDIFEEISKCIHNHV